ncbi:MAG: hypothetical protein V4582_07550 [Pseudomonadota bacterium]
MIDAFDTLDYAQQLETAGVPKAQAEIHAKALAGVLSTSLVTQNQFEVFDCQINTRFDAFERRMDEFEHRVLARFDAFERRMDAYEARADAKLLKMSDELKLHCWMMGTLITMNIGILLKLFMH